MSSSVTKSYKRNSNDNLTVNKGLTETNMLLGQIRVGEGGDLDTYCDIIIIYWKWIIC